MSQAIDIIVVPRDRVSVFPRCLDALFAHTHLPFRLIVVAGGVDRKTEPWLRELEARHADAIVVLEDHLLLQGESRNIGLRHVRERYCVVLENDTIVHDNWLAPMLECMQEEAAAAVMPLVFWYRGVHSAGCLFDEQKQDGATVFTHTIMYTDIRRKPIGYPECHCILIDRQLLSDTDLFDDVEPFDVDLGVTLRRTGLKAFIEPRSSVTYAAPPPLEVRDVPLYKFRWDGALWEARNRLFMAKWGVRYDASSKAASYRRQQLKLGLARWYPTQGTVAASNVATGLANRLYTLALGKRLPHSPE
jgi:glycosyltransferase involved in cell wall biosynthesis